MKKSFWRALIEIAFIIFLFYANLLMGEFTRRVMGRGQGIGAAFEDIFTGPNFVIAVVAALIGYVIFEFLRKKL
jgi:hypothetical protein